MEELKNSRFQIMTQHIVTKNPHILLGERWVGGLMDLATGRWVEGYDLYEGASMDEAYVKAQDGLFSYLVANPPR